jgi:DNA-binding transcriptional regulator LsrR (DeoR family)
MSHRQIARNLGIPKTTVSFISKKWREEGIREISKFSEVENDEALIDEIRTIRFLVPFRHHTLHILQAQ